MWNTLQNGKNLKNELLNKNNSEKKIELTISNRCRRQGLNLEHHAREIAP